RRCARGNGAMAPRRSRLSGRRWRPGCRPGSVAVVAPGLLVLLAVALGGFAVALDLLALAFVLHATGLELLAVTLAVPGRGGMGHAPLGALPVRIHAPAVVIQRLAVALRIGLTHGLVLVLARGRGLLARALPG